MDVVEEICSRCCTGQYSDKESSDEFEDANDHFTSESVRPKPKDNGHILSRLSSPPSSPRPLSHPDSFGDLFSLLAPSKAKSHRRRLPILRDRSSLNLWSLLKNLIGKDVTRIALPVNLNEPLSFCQRLVEDIEYSDLCHKAAGAGCVAETLSYLAALASSCWVSTVSRYGKPFNPLLGETYELVNTENGYCALSEQVSHHPPVTALHIEAAKWVFWEEYKLDIKFRGQWVRIQPTGLVHFRTKENGYHYSWNKPYTTIHNLIIGNLWADHEGDVTVRCHQTGEEANVTFSPHNKVKDRYKEIHGEVLSALGEVNYLLEGSWETHMYRKHPDGSACTSLWKANSPIQNHDRQYGFTEFATSLNEEDDSVRCPTDSRKRTDQRMLENSMVDDAADEKYRLEEKQRGARKKREQRKEKWKPLWFDLSYDADTKTSYHMFNGRYWRARLNDEFSQCPDIF